MEIEKYQEILAAFPGRNEAMRMILRYSIYKVMYYRTDILTHATRVAFMLAELAPRLQHILGPDFNVERSLVLALVHDDAEIVFGDIQAGNKSKMTDAQLREVADAEEKAIEKIAQQFPKKIGNYNYKELLQDATAMETLDAQVVKYLDKYDAFGESLHEVFAGNTCFTTNVVNEYGTIPLPTDYYVSWITKFHQDKRQLAQQLQGAGVIFSIPQTLDCKEVAKNHTLHSLQTLIIPTNYPHYDWWKSTLLKQGRDDEEKRLLTQKEFGSVN